MGVWGTKVRVGALLGGGARGRRADVDRFRMDGNRGCGRDDVQRGGIRRDAAVYVRVRWVMAMGARSSTAVRGWVASELLALWVWGPPSVARDGHVRSAVGISQDHARGDRMAALGVGILRAEPIVGVADQRWRHGGAGEGVARQGVDPFGGAGASGLIVSDGLWICRILCHLSTLGRVLARKGRQGGAGVAEAFIDLFFRLFIFAKRTVPQRVLNEVHFLTDSRRHSLSPATVSPTEPISHAASGATYENTPDTRRSDRHSLSTR